jgi:RNA polymerase sigma-70 factor, ECF subfamily
MSLLGALWQPPAPAAVVREHGPEVYRLLRRIFGPRADIDDTYQTVFVEVLRSLPSFAGRARLSAWIRRITWNVAYQEMRLRYREQCVTTLDDHEPAGSDPQPSLQAREALRALHAALAELDPKQRLAVTMHDIEGCTLKEISEATGRPLPTVASQLAAGRARLADALAAAKDTRGEPQESPSAREELAKP